MGDTPPRIDGVAAAAILLTLLDDASASDLVARLGANDVRRLGPAMLSVASASPADIDAALDVFVSGCRGASEFGSDAAVRARAVLTTAIGEERARTILPPLADPHAKLRETLRWMPDAAIARALAGEAPQAAALIVANLDASTAATALATLEEAHRFDVIFRAARIETVDPGAIEALCSGLADYADDVSPGPGSTDGTSKLAKTIAKLPRDQSARLLAQIRKRDKVLGQAIEDEMFVFADLLGLSDRDLGGVLRSVDASVLTLALRGADASVVDKLLGCLSARAAQSIRDDIAEASPAKRTDVEDAQRAVVAAARAMAADGGLQLAGQSDDYV